MNDAEMALLNQAAGAIGSPTSTWTRLTLLAEALSVRWNERLPATRARRSAS